MHPIEEPGHVPSLVGLQRADQVPGDPRRKLGKLFPRLLNPVFAHVRYAPLHGGQHPRQGHALGHGDQRHFVRLSPRTLQGAAEPLPHRVPPLLQLALHVDASKTFFRPYSSSPPPLLHAGGRPFLTAGPAGPDSAPPGRPRAPRPGPPGARRRPEPSPAGTGSDRPAPRRRPGGPPPPRRPPPAPPPPASSRW